jgi:carboxylesterase type B
MLLLSVVTRYVQTIHSWGGKAYPNIIIQKKVVLFGQSAGATDVFTIASLPQAPDLIKAVIAESIPDTQLLLNSTLQSTGASYAKALNCSVGDVSAEIPSFVLNGFFRWKC